jgi:Sigma-70 region 2
MRNPVVFDDRFSRCRRLLYFMARRVLGDSEGAEEAEEAMQNCFLTASRNPPRFEHEGAFRRWLLRILIDEALLILRQKNTRRSASDRSHASVARRSCLAICTEASQALDVGSIRTARSKYPITRTSSINTRLPTYNCSSRSVSRDFAKIGQNRWAEYNTDALALVRQKNMRNTTACTL